MSRSARRRTSEDLRLKVTELNGNLMKSDEIVHMMV